MVVWGGLALWLRGMVDLLWPEVGLWGGEFV